MRTRKTNAQDIPALKSLWQEAFPEDAPCDIERFFEALYPSSIGFCSEEEGEICAMLFALPQTIVKDETQLKSAYLYAIATQKAFRGQGLCKALIAFAEKELRKRYFDAVMLSPASSLAAFYETLGFRAQGRMNKTILPCDAPKGQATVIGVQDYAGLRETLLWDTAHVRFDKAQLSYAMAGGEVYCLMAGYDMGCAMTGASQNGCVLVRELLPSAAVLPALAEKLGAGNYALESRPGETEGEVFAMLKWLDAPHVELEPVYLGLALN